VHKKKKNRLLVVGAAAAVGVTVLTLLPSANAAESAQQIMDKCNKARKINGVSQTFPQIDDLPLADTCDFEQTSFTTFDGTTAKVSIDYPNCAPDTVENAKASVKEDWSTAQITGKYTYTQFGGNLGFFGALNISWKSHTGTLDLTTKTVTTSNTDQFNIPIGKVLHVEFTPKMYKMTGIWHVKTKSQSIGIPDYAADAPEEVVGPKMLDNGLADGTTTPVYADC
jgi:hypothetical protein